MGFKEEADLDAAIKTTDGAIRRARNKELGIEEEEKVCIRPFPWTGSRSTKWSYPNRHFTDDMGIYSLFAS